MQATFCLSQILFQGLGDNEMTQDPINPDITIIQKNIEVNVVHKETRSVNFYQTPDGKEFDNLYMAKRYLNTKRSRSILNKFRYIIDSDREKWYFIESKEMLDLLIEAMLLVYSVEEVEDPKYPSRYPSLVYVDYEYTGLRNRFLAVNDLKAILE